MILEPAEAQAFIAGYQAILLMLTSHHDIASRRGFLASLMEGRQVLAQELCLPFFHPQPSGCHPNVFVMQPPDVLELLDDSRVRYLNRSTVRRILR